MTFIKNFLKDEDGASAVEYAVLVALIAGGVTAAVAAFDIGGLFTKANGVVDGQIK